MDVQKRGRLNQRTITVIVSCILFGLLGCRYLYPIHYYDATTYRNLTETKPVVIALYETFTDNTVKSEGIEAVRIRLAQIYEYEKGKGERNIETTQQVKIIQDMFERHVQDRLSGRAWNATHLENMKENIAQAFDIAIATERAKNKNE